MSRQDWKKQMRESFESYAEPAPEGLWEAVNAGLQPGGDALRAAKSSRQQRRAWPYAAAACAAFAAVALLLVPRSEEPVRPEPMPLLASAVTEPVLSDADFPAPLPVPPARPAVTDRVPPMQDSAPATEPASAPNPVHVPDPSVTGSSSEHVTEPISEPGPLQDLEFADAEIFASGEEKTHRPERALSLRLGYSGMGSSSSSSYGYDALYGSSVAALRYSSGVVADNGYTAVLMSNNSQVVTTDRRHYQPISLGVRAAWDFAPRLSLVGGLEYSCLVSDLSSGTGDNRYDIRQTLHYLGVPLALEWSVVSAGRLRVYLSAGGQMRKALYGSSRTTYVLGNQTSYNAQEEQLQPQLTAISEAPLQWSAGLGAGLEYSLGNSLGLYFEPAAVYYFDNGSPVENYFKSHPFSFSLSLGLRIRLQ